MHCQHAFDVTAWDGMQFLHCGLHHGVNKVCSAGHGGKNVLCPGLLLVTLARCLEFVDRKQSVLLIWQLSP